MGIDTSTPGTKVLVISSCSMTLKKEEQQPSQGLIKYW
jgi:hypothetical protein